MKQLNICSNFDISEQTCRTNNLSICGHSGIQTLLKIYLIGYLTILHMLFLHNILCKISEITENFKQLVIPAYF